MIGPNLVADAKAARLASQIPLDWSQCGKEIPVGLNVKKETTEEP